MWDCRNLDVLAHHGNHEVEQTNGFDEGETKNGVGEELATESRVAGDGQEERTENNTDTNTGTTETDGSRAHTNVLGDLDHGVGDLRRVLAAGSEALASGGLDHGGLLALDGLEGDGLALGGESALGDGLDASGRAGNLGGCGHGGGQALGKDTRGGHCEEWELRWRRREREWNWRWTEDGREEEEKRREREEVFQEGRKMGRKMALAPKYVSRLIFALFSQTLRAFRALATLGGWEQPYAEPPVLPVRWRRGEKRYSLYSIPIWASWHSTLGRSGSFGMGPSSLSFGAANNAPTRGAVVSCRGVSLDRELLKQQVRNAVESTGCSSHGEACPLLPSFRDDG